MADRRSSRRYLIYLAVALAIFSNYLYTGEWFSRFADYDPNAWGTRHVVASLLLLGGILAAAITFGPAKEFEPAPDAEFRPQEPIRWWKLAPCLALLVSANALYAFRGESPVVRWLWLFAVILLIGPLLRRLDLRDFWPIPAWEYLLVVLITAAAFALRYVHLTDVPFQIDNDVAIMGGFSRALVTQNDWTWIGMAPSEHQYSEHQIHALSMRLFGANHYGLVMFSVLAGTATVPLLYLIGRVCFNRWVGLIAAGFLAFNYVHIHFSRIVFGPITTFSLTLGSLFLLHGIKRNNPLSMALGGVGLGLSLLGYYSGRVSLAILGCTLVFLLLMRRKYEALRQSIWLVILGVLATFGPNLIYVISTFHKFNGRGNTVILWTQEAWTHASTTYGGGAWVVWREQIRRTLLSPFFFPDSGTICNLTEPMLGVAAGLFTVLGAGYCLRRLSQLEILYPTLWIGLTFLCGGILTTNPPFWPHLNIALPALALVAGLGAERLYQTLSGLHRRNIAPFAIPLLAGIILFSGIQNFIVYFDFATKHATPTTMAMRVVQEIGPAYRVVFVSDDVKWDHEAFEFFCRDHEGSDLSPAQFLQNPPTTVAKPTAFFIFRDAPATCLDYFKTTFPSALREHNRSAGGDREFTVVRLLPKGYSVNVEQVALPDSSIHFGGWGYLAGGAFLFLLPVVFLLRRELALEPAVAA